MRVTKLIKEYVEKEVALAIPNPEKPEVPLKEEYEALIDSLEAHCRKTIKEFVCTHGGEFYFSFSGYDANNVEAQLAYVDRSCELRCPTLYPVIIDNYKKVCGEKAKERAAAVENILITLELGGTKAELEEMISKLKA